MDLYKVKQIIHPWIVNKCSKVNRKDDDNSVINTMINYRIQNYH